MKNTYNGSVGASDIFASGGELSYDSVSDAHPVGWVLWEFVITDCRFRDGPLGRDFDAWDVQIHCLQFKFKVSSETEGVSNQALDTFVRSEGLRVDTMSLGEIIDLHPDLPADRNTGAVPADNRVYEVMNVKAWQVVWVAMSWAIVVAFVGSVAALAALVFVPLAVQWRRQRRSLCPRCAYPGQPGVCPECGLAGAFDPPQA